jgi:hypothetical protein
MDWPGTLNLCSLRDSDQESNTQTKDKLKSRLLSLLQSREYSLYDSRGKPLQVLPTPQPLAESQELNPVQTENTLNLNKQKLGQLLNGRYRALLTSVARNSKRSGPVLSNSDKSSLNALSQRYGTRKLYYALIPPPTSPVHDVAAEVDRNGTNIVVDSHSSVGTIETPVTGDQHSDPRMSQRGFAAATPVSSTMKGETNFEEDASPKYGQEDLARTIAGTPSTDTEGSIEERLDFTKCIDKHPLEASASTHSSSPQLEYDQEDLNTRTSARTANLKREGYKALCGQDLDTTEPKVSKLETNEDDVIDMLLVSGKMRASESEQLQGHATDREETASDGDMEESPANIAHNISPDKVLAAKRLLATREGREAQNRFADSVGIHTTCCNVLRRRYVYVGPNLNVCLSGKVDILQGNYLFEVKHSFSNSTIKELGKANLRECLFYMVICQLDCAFFVVEHSRKIFVVQYDEGFFQEIVKQAKVLEAESLRLTSVSC